jgi:hypothetical protein
MGIHLPLNLAKYMNRFNADECALDLALIDVVEFFLEIPHSDAEGMIDAWPKARKEFVEKEIKKCIEEAELIK